MRTPKTITLYWHKNTARINYFLFFGISGDHRPRLLQAELALSTDQAHGGEIRRERLLRTFSNRLFRIFSKPLRVSPFYFFALPTGSDLTEVSRFLYPVAERRWSPFQIVGNRESARVCGLLGLQMFEKFKITKRRSADILGMHTGRLVCSSPENVSLLEIFSLQVFSRSFTRSYTLEILLERFYYKFC